MTRGINVSGRSSTISGRSVDIGSVGSVTLDSFEDQNLSEYLGDTGSFDFNTSTAYDGSVSVEATSTDVLIYTDSSVTTTGTSKTATVYQYSGGGSHRGGVVLLNSNGDGYGAYLQSDSIDLNKYTNGAYDSIINQNSGISASDDTWHQISIEHDGSDGYTASVNPAGGSDLGSVTDTDSTYSSLDRVGIYSFDTGVPYDLLDV